VDAALMFGLVAPAATPAAVIKVLNESAAASVRTDPLRARLLELGYVPIGSTAEEFRARIAADIAKWSRIVEAAGIKPN
jgi:tripartite-type tricarboxylate transporter receptor subunit TctC